MAKHVFEYLLDAGAQEPKTVALEFLKQPITYGELAQRARVVASGLAAHDVAPGVSVGLLLPNIPQFAEALYGSWIHGNVVVPMNVLLTPPEIRYLVDDSAIRALFVYEMFLPAVEAAIADMPAPPRVFVIGNAGRHTAYADLFKHAPAAPEKVTEDRHILTIYTSGTTGKPKGAVITQQQRDRAARHDGRPVRAGPGRPRAVRLAAVPRIRAQRRAQLQHPPSRHDRAAPQVRLERHGEGLEDEGITVFAGVPTMYFYFLKHPELRRSSSSRRCATAFRAAPACRSR